MIEHVIDTFRYAELVVNHEFVQKTQSETSTAHGVS